MPLGLSSRMNRAPLPTRPRGTMHTREVPVKKKDIPDSRKQRGAFAGILKMVGPVALGTLLAGIVAFLAAGRIDWIWAWVSVGISLLNVLVVYPLTLRFHPGTAGGARRRQSETDRGYHRESLLTSWPRTSRCPWWPASTSVSPGRAISVSPLMVRAPRCSRPDRCSRRGLPRRMHTRGRKLPFNAARRSAEPGPIGLSGTRDTPDRPSRLSVSPLLLGSLWALIPGIAVTVFMIIATHWEDRTLQAALPGYRDYAREVRFRLVPVIW